MRRRCLAILRIVVESSPGKYHRYILTESANLDQFEPVQQRLVDDFGSDRNAKDRSRVLRLPGFYHQKVNARKGLVGTPHMVRVIRQSGAPPLPWGEVLKRLPPVETATNATRPVLPAQPGTLPPAIADWAKNLSAAAPNEDQKADLWSALCAIPAADREIWVAVGMELKTIPDQEYGFQLFHEWSKRAPEAYRGEDDCRRHWKGFQPDRTGWRSVFAKAFGYGWINPKSTEGRAMAARDAPEIEYRDVVNCNPDTDEDLVDAYRKQERRKFNDKHGSLMIEGKAVVVYRQRNENTSQVETKFAIHAAISTHYSNRKLPEVVRPENRPAYVRWYRGVYKDWKYRHNRRTYTQPVFAPDPDRLATEAMPDSGGPYNLYVGANFEPAKGVCDLILGHIYNVWCRCDDETYWYVIRWMARMVQQPGTQGDTVIVLRSGEGGGKISFSTCSTTISARTPSCSRNPTTWQGSTITSPQRFLFSSTRPYGEGTGRSRVQ